jgi:hypothetical protein
MLPLGYRIFTVGNLTNAFAQSVSVFALTMLAASRLEAVRSANALLLAAVLAVAFMSHTSTFPILFVSCVAAAILMRWKGDERVRHASSVVLVATLLAAAVAIGLYYAHFGETYRSEFSRIRTETVTAAPDAGGRGLAARARIVPAYLRSYLGLGALVLTAVGATSLYRRGARDQATLATAGWALSCLAFLAVGVLTPVDMRYYLAAIPVVAIGTAAGAAALWQQPAPRFAAIVLLVVVCWGGVVTWYTTF